MITNAEIINLFKFVNDGNLLELQKILKNNTDNKSKKKLDKVKDRSGRTLIHAAIDRNNKQIIDAFLAIDVSLKEVNADGKTVLTVAEERGLEQLAALLRTRLEWQETIKTFRINQIMHLLMEGFPDIKRANGRNKVLFIASTGAGKSTLVNYLNGTRYKILKNAMGVEAIPSGGVPEIAKVGRSSYESETLHPQVIEKEGLDFIYCDIAGLFDSRGDEEQIFAASSLHMLSKQTVKEQGGIKAIIVVLDTAGFATKKAENFKQTALTLAGIVKENPDLMDSVYFVISKVEPDLIKELSREDIIEKLFKPMLNRLYNDELDEFNELTEEEKPLFFTLNEICKRKQIVIPDITDLGASRTEIEQMLINTEVKDANLFNFLSHGGETQKIFNAAILKMANSFLSRYQQIMQDYPTKFTQNHTDLAEQELNINRWRAEVAGIDQELSSNFDANRLLRSIQEKEATIAANIAQINLIEAARVTTNSRIMELSTELGRLDNNNQIEVHRKTVDCANLPTSCTVTHFSEYPLSRISYNFSGYGSKSQRLIRPQSTGRQFVSPDDNKLVDGYMNDDDALNGRYEETFSAALGITEIIITFYARSKYKFATDIQVLKQQLNTVKQEQSRGEQRIIALNTENRRLERAIAEARIEKTTQENRLEIRKDELRRQKQELLAQIEVANGRQQGLIVVQQQYERDLSKIKLEIQVNHDLFRAVSEVIDLLDLNYDDYLRFQQEYNEYITTETVANTPLLFVANLPPTQEQQVSSIQETMQARLRLTP
ncbi:MAG: hypothetical protein ABSA84_03715 [Gammaproteobacteria bacterium]